MKFFQDEKIWRLLSNGWTIVFLVFILVNFFSRGRYEYLVGPLSVVYVGILSLYVGTKEFDRWYEFHSDRHPGELFVIAWTVVVFLLLALSIFMGAGYVLGSEIVTDYIIVLSIFALTQKSKRLHRKRHA